MGQDEPWKEIPEAMQTFMRKQKVFFVATAPSGPDGHVNVSPKGYADCFAILSPRRVAYLDLGGSGVETFSHVTQNGRITFLFCNMESGPPCILRLWCKAQAHERGTPGFDQWLRAAFADASSQPELWKAMRSIVVADVTTCARSCGYAVPIFKFQEDRDVYLSYARRAAPDALLQSRKANMHSLDGLPALRLPDPDAYTHEPPAAAGGRKPRAAGAAHLARSAAPWISPAVSHVLVALAALLLGNLVTLAARAL